jgi:ribosomal protein L11 methyltransferase
LATITGDNYDIILANINRNVILATLGDLKQKMAENGQLIISGFLSADENILRKACKDNGLQVVEVKERNNWLCMLIH